MDDITSSFGNQRNVLPESSANTYQSPPPASSSGSAAKVAAEPNKTAPYGWILNPTIDLLFACGGIFWLLFAVFVATGSQINLYGSPAAFWLAVASIMGLHFLGDPHQPATLWRVYFSKSTREKLAVPVSLLLVAAIGIGIWSYMVPAATVFFLKLTLAWGFQHQLAQSFGIALVYCYKRKYYLTKMEKNIMNFMVHATMVFLIVRMFSLKDFGTYVLFNSYNLPFNAVLPEWATTVSLIVLQISVVAFVAMVVRKYIKQKQLFPLPGLLTLSTLIVMPFFAQNAFIMVWMLISQWYFHSSQYLVITSAFYFKERGLPEGVPMHEIAKMLKTKTFAKYYASILLLGFLCSYLFPRWLSEHGAASTGIAFAAVYVAVNLHHFITDAFIWKLRDPAVQKLLVA
jgi:hypothetical protein